MVRVPIQYFEPITWLVRKVVTGENEWGQPIYEEEYGESEGRYANYRGSKKEFLGQDGQTIMHADGVFYIKVNEPYPNRFDIVTWKEQTFQVVHTWEGQLHTIIYLKEVK